LYTAQKSNSYYAPQPYTNQSVFKSLLNCTSEVSLSRNATGREFQRHGPATEKTKDSLSTWRRISDCLWLCPQLSLDIPYWIDAESGSWYDHWCGRDGFSRRG